MRCSYIKNHSFLSFYTKSHRVCLDRSHQLLEMGLIFRIEDSQYPGRNLFIRTDNPHAPRFLFARNALEKKRERKLHAATENNNKLQIRRFSSNVQTFICTSK